LKPPRLCTFLFDCHIGPERSREFVLDSSALTDEEKEQHMFATIRRYDGVDQNRTNELTGKVNETLVPELRKLPGFKGYYLIEAGNGIFSSLGLFETPEQSEESSKVVATWIRHEHLETLIPNEAKITSGKVVAHSNGVAVA
jgi:hypothetical protein